MVTVALAGASTGLGLVILKQILATKKHTVVLLSRNENPTLTALGAIVRPVAYTDHAALVAALRDVDTVISTIGTFDAAVMRDSQLALLAAAREAGARRFVPSEWALSSAEGLDAYKPKLDVWEAVQASGLEYTKFSCGLFMNVLGNGTPRGTEEALGGLRPWDFVVNMRAGTADLPGDGRARLTFTETSDIGRFVAAALELESWPEELAMEGETMSFRDVVALAGEVTGRKYLIKENSVAELQRMVEEQPQMAFYNQARILFARGLGVVEPNLNKLCPDVKPITVKGYLEKWWKGVPLDEPAWGANNIIK